MAHKKVFHIPKYKFGDVLLIEWDDAQCFTDGRGYYKEDIKEIEVALCNTVGFFIDEDDKSIKIAFKLCEDGMFRNVVAIPKGCITLIKKLGRCRDGRNKK